MLQEIVTGCASLGGPPELDAFRKHLPREWIEEALRATGTATLRRRRLPAEQVVWLVLGMALFKDRSITDVVNKLDLALPGSGHVTVAPNAISQARARLGQEPVRWLSARLCQRWLRHAEDPATRRRCETRPARRRDRAGQPDNPNNQKPLSAHAQTDPQASPGYRPTVPPVVSTATRP